jgi:PleD family two-component response regulator
MGRLYKTNLSNVKHKGLFSYIYANYELISLGISHLELADESQTFEDLIEQADTAMYNSKKVGRIKTSTWQKIVM